jgi:hypothetical protein
VGIPPGRWAKCTSTEYRAKGRKVRVIDFEGCDLPSKDYSVLYPESKCILSPDVGSCKNQNMRAFVMRNYHLNVLITVVCLGSLFVFWGLQWLRKNDYLPEGGCSL